MAVVERQSLEGMTLQATENFLRSLEKLAYELGDIASGLETIEEHLVGSSTLEAASGGPGCGQTPEGQYPLLPKLDMRLGQVGDAITACVRVASRLDSSKRRLAALLFDDPAKAKVNECVTIATAPYTAGPTNWR